MPGRELLWAELKARATLRLSEASHLSRAARRYGDNRVSTALEQKKQTVRCLSPQPRADKFVPQNSYFLFLKRAFAFLTGRLSLCVVWG